MVRVISALFAFLEGFFSWLPPYLCTFVTSVFGILVSIFIVLIAAKVITLGISLIKG
jgi:hypothetical protein